MKKIYIYQFFPLCGIPMRRDNEFSIPNEIIFKRIKKTLLKSEFFIFHVTNLQNRFFLFISKIREIDCYHYDIV